MTPYDMVGDFIESFNPIFVLAVGLSLPILAWFSYHIIKETLADIRNFKYVWKSRNVERVYNRYTVVAVESRKNPTIIGVIEGDSVIPIKCYDGTVEDMLLGLVRLNPGKAPIMDACVNPDTFTLIKVRGYSLVDNSVVDNILKGNNVGTTDSVAKTEVDRRVFKETWGS